MGAAAAAADDDIAPAYLQSHSYDFCRRFPAKNQVVNKRVVLESECVNEGNSRNASCGKQAEHQVKCFQFTSICAG